ncbi:TonB-dependent receptor domain-containing protein [Erythrobacter sp. HL-111]|uniref:TonB-dependent receptor family protein n=1 Tax=Erythrobacter sp. HL-111 TaxID=1798193 RepID=UPI0006D9E7C3|nr:TonB-dependent receptor [Erythrobacter sp. HL-111]KPP95418.1 MAG: TonB-dependent receptor [Erythrobacteraceae bacterium HL-111]SDS69526.1 iron complex outermembrane recepter protein [Erythrobacter sp. HL-111]
MHLSDFARPLFAITLLSSPACLLHAQGIGQRQDEIIVTAAAAGSPTSPSVEEAREELERIPGAIGVVEDEGFADIFAQSIGDTLELTPGVFSDTSAQRESRISIRGSGLNSSFERRGLMVLRDGVPISRSAGNTEFQEIDPLTIRYIEVFKGANGLRYGATQLGGAVNVVSPTGRTARSPVALRAEGGSFETFRANASLAGAGENTDHWIGVTGLTSEGYREQSEVRSLYGHGNFGWRVADNIETRFYVTALTDNFELAGTLTLEDALANPRAAGRTVTIGPFFPGGPVTVLDPGPVADDWDRNLGVIRVSNLTAIDMGGAELEIGAWYSRRSLDHAITRFAGIIVQGEDEVGGSVRLSGDLPFLAPQSRWQVGAIYAFGSNDAQVFENLSGERGALTSRSDQDSSMLMTYGQLDLGLTDRVTVIAGGQYARAVRDVEVILDAVAGRGEYDQFNPCVGVLFDVAQDIQVFGNVNRSFEPPSLADLTSGGAFPFAPLDEQRATVFEIGTRGAKGVFSWDIAAYRAELENEFLDFAVPGARGLVTVTGNGDRTIHQGIEAGVDLRPAKDVLAARGQSLRLSAAYTFNDFAFDDDAIYGDNRLAGVPRHVLIAETRFDQVDDWYLSATLRFIPEGPWADYANTERAPGYETVQLTAGVTVLDDFILFGSVENLFDRVFISNLATVADQSATPSAIYTPGQGRAFFGGIRARF